ncbi:dihydropteroate synthase [Haloplanus aerogenes]|uniref:Probable bifunctional folylpolyglutamate synthase/dihydropteroate synthase n=1 Tax=Haloplanus aerogenes TaxID=660522 RepID=A0A3G8QT20_9EURY|nr:dihydropteroate synthase [Haloplanus aerogenes]AZH25596.1 dihydropteroate synthase [Haloplanus aerogenes]RMB25317.1 dihydropteroate synthase [Haloplanus aerogenes]
MDYHAAADFLSDLRRFALDPGTGSTRELLAHLGDPHEDVAFVQVAGSNGKGSTARMTESILREAGYRVGLYTSPHFDDLRERIRVDGRKITESAVIEFVEEVRPFLVDRAVEGDPLTSFETLTAMSLWYFGRSDVDVAVLEVGMGGRLDATSVVDPVAAAVTAVSLEHTDILGDTLDEIAAEKVTVAPDDAPLVTGATDESLRAVRRHAPDALSVGFADESPDVTVRYDGLVNHTEAGIAVEGDDWGVETRVPMAGAYQARNAGVASVLARQVGDDHVTEPALARGLRNAHWPGRFEVVEYDPLVVLDGAHNPGACEALATTLGEYDYGDLHLVFGAMHDKDHRSMAAALPPAASVRTCAPAHERASDPAVLAAAFEAAGDADVVETATSVAAALDDARNAAGPEDCVLVVGSLFAVAEARRTWSRLAIGRRIDDADDARAVLDHAHAADADVVGESVHRLVTTRLDRREARALDRAAGQVGATAVTADYRTGRELRDAVIAGTDADLQALLAALDGRGLGNVADTLRRQIGDGDAPDGDGDAPDGDTHAYPWTESPAVMSILNVTPDSFHDGGDFFDESAAVERAEAMVEAGADVIDVGGESTRPGADPVPPAEEIERVRPVIEALADLDVLVSIDTRKAEVGRAALEAGADILNDVTGLADPEMRFLAAEFDVPVVVMHSIDAPVVPGKTVTYDDVVSDVIDELAERVALAERAGLSRDNVIVDPGLGFGKDAVENFELLDRLDEFRALGCPILVGHSHKSMYAHVGQEAGERLPATIAATALAVDRGADIVRVHDVPENVAAVRTAVATGDAAGVPDEWRA